MNYGQARAYAVNVSRSGSILGLDSIENLMHELGDIQEQLKIIHIAGTNGKGSTGAYLERVLIEAGYRVGRYSSPAVFDPMEVWRINLQSMSHEEYADIMEQVKCACDRMVEKGMEHPTIFEVETAMAFLYFYQKKCDYVLLEVGMGGRTDATNVIRKPVCSVITSVSMDHMQFLGDTLTKIATEKAGIIKPYTTVISAPQVPEVSKVLREICEVQHASYIEVNPSDWEVVQMNLDGTEVVDCGTNPDESNMDADMDQRQQPYHIPLLGEHQIANAQTAITVLRTLYIEETAIHKGIAQTVWLGRMTKVAEHPYIYVDGAHNVAAWEYLRTSVEKYFTNRRVIYIIGVLKDKEYEKMVEILAPTMAAAVVITPDTPRGLPKEILAPLIQAQGVPVQLADTSAEALQKAREQAGETGVILVSGSLSFLAEYLQLESGDENNGASR